MRGSGIAIFQILRLISTKNRGSEKSVKLVSATASPILVVEVMLFDVVECDKCRVESIWVIEFVFMLMGFQFW
jgi:hypothetical protein